jgi:hypothetical protein
MAREKNTIESIQITLSVTEPIRVMLEDLSRSGFYGKNAADTAGMLLREKLRDMQIAVGTSPGISRAAVPA